MLGYVGRLLKRMQLRGWPPADPLYAEVRAAEKALHDLHVRLIYLAAPPGTAGQPARLPQAPLPQGPLPQAPLPHAPLPAAARKFNRPPRGKREVEKDTPWGARGDQAPGD